jgi:hypothetical protein
MEIVSSAKLAGSYTQTCSKANALMASGCMLESMVPGHNTQDKLETIFYRGEKAIQLFVSAAAAMASVLATAVR